MFIICRKGHLGIYWEKEVPVFVEHDAGIFPSRKSCLNYLVNECGIEKEQAVSTITLMQKSKNWISF